MSAPAFAQSVSYTHLDVYKRQPYSLVFADKQMNQESLEYFKLTLDMAKEIGSEYCMFACNHPGFGRYKAVSYTHLSRDLWTAFRKA